VCSLYEGENWSFTQNEEEQVLVGENYVTSKETKEQMWWLCPSLFASNKCPV